MKELPKWFIKKGGEQYTEGGTATNPFSRSSIALNNNELSMYDFIIGCQRVTMDREIQTDFRKAIDWFRKANPEAYMVLLD
jgi:hypothetical protein